MEIGDCRVTQIFHNTEVGMKHVVFLLIGIMMAGGMAAAEATGNESATKATIPIGSTIEIPVSEGSKEVVFDVEGVEITTQAELEAVEGGRPVRDDPMESISYSKGETDVLTGRSRIAYAKEVAQWLDVETTIRASVSFSVRWRSPSLDFGYDIYPEKGTYLTISGGPLSVKFILSGKQEFHDY
jgi:hypothetical protein